jgi:tetratricopeptide (TPR) repeat protein
MKPKYRCTKIGGIFVCVLLLSPGTSVAKERVKKVVPTIKPIELKTKQSEPTKSGPTFVTKRDDNRPKSGSSKAWSTFQDLRKSYRTGLISDEDMWVSLSKLSEDTERLSPTQRSAILQVQSTLLSKAKRPILSSIYAAQSLLESPNPLDEDYKRSWQILRDVSRKQPIQNLLDMVASNIKLGSRPAPIFATDWNYFLANAQLKEKDLADALKLYRGVKTGDRYFLPAKFQESMILLDQNDKKGAQSALKTIVQSPIAMNRKMTRDEYYAMLDQANMALGRLYYEDRKFPESIKHYRQVQRDGNQFYDSLFEQSWALFMAGYPNHALGTIYSVKSPFFKDTFNPEATMLSSIIYYWMCRYDDARQELGEFYSKHQNAIDDLNRYLAKGISDSSTYYRLFEDTVSGVSSAGLGMPRELLTMAIQQDNMMLVRDQYASVIAESQKLDSEGIFESRERLDVPRRYLEKWSASLKDDIGLRLYRELRSLKADYERLYDQGQFLYVELLMSKKDQLLGKELHSEGKLATLSTNENIRSWSKKTQTWASDNKQEYWADELGFHIVRVQPMCVVNK